MGYVEIDIRNLKEVVNILFDHLSEDLHIDSIKIDDGHDLYWSCPASELYDVSKAPVGLEVGSLSDDIRFLKLVRRDETGNISYNFVHVVPLLRYVAETVKG